MRRSNFNGVKVFSATLKLDRERLGDDVTAWITAHPSFEIVDIVITQSSDAAFHLVACSVFYFEEELQNRAGRPIK